MEKEETTFKLNNLIIRVSQLCIKYLSIYNKNISILLKVKMKNISFMEDKKQKQQKRKNIVEILQKFYIKVIENHSKKHLLMENFLKLFNTDYFQVGHQSNKLNFFSQKNNSDISLSSQNSQTSTKELLSTISSRADIKNQFLNIFPNNYSDSRKLSLVENSPQKQSIQNRILYKQELNKSHQYFTDNKSLLTKQLQPINRTYSYQQKEKIQSCLSELHYTQEYVNEEIKRVLVFAIFRSFSLNDFSYSYSIITQLNKALPTHAKILAKFLKCLKCFFVQSIENSCVLLTHLVDDLPLEFISSLFQFYCIELSKEAIACNINKLSQRISTQITFCEITDSMVPNKTSESTFLNEIVLISFKNNKTFVIARNKSGSSFIDTTVNVAKKKYILGLSKIIKSLETSNELKIFRCQRKAQVAIQKKKLAQYFANF